MTVIYVDILLALNLFIDYLLLAATARLLQRPVRRKRHLAAALLGALSSLLILLPPLPALLTALLQAVAAAGMVWVMFGAQGTARFLRDTSVLFVISALFAGICQLGQLWAAPQGLTVRNGICYYAVPPMLLVALTVCSYGVLCLFERLTRKRVAVGCHYRVEIADGGCLLLLEAMLDSGHSLNDPFSGTPVILVKECAVRPLCTRYDLRTPRGGVRFIPYRCAAGDGMLTAFRPEAVTLYANGQAVDISGVWIAATTALVREEYDALIGPALADRLPHTTFGKELCP